MGWGRVAAQLPLAATPAQARLDAADVDSRQRRADVARDFVGGRRPKCLESGCVFTPTYLLPSRRMLHGRRMMAGRLQAGRKPASNLSPSEFCPGGFLSPLSTYVTHKMLGSQKLRKRILDDANRVAFYVPCALVEGATGEFRARSFSRILCVFAQISACLRGWRKRWAVGACGTKRETCRTGINCLLTLYLVFAGRFDAR